MAGISEFTQAFFEDSRKAWKANKVKYGQAMYRYKKNAFPVDLEEPSFPQSMKSKKQTEKELLKRQSIDEPAPLPLRKSPRLREQHNKTVYA